ncbi:hypothetical protein Kfla_3258 [Kribbella flavida DSM 17836]|uniref:Uncharacterized protein n=1 Tax=Kribbella flavida (strain DSM 17836 / JCM 10339 / NBRC 14399) TaxID=479435 RepID=D2Q4K5_KRIFD|nr:hypothetical protein [Kribbella flavida]ADB32319.1 hypothetical protein Kfla_3258 [Kribbella flavida DSM 17836]
MSTEIEDLLSDAADDSAQPLRHSVDDVVRRGRRGQRIRRAGAVAAGAVAVAGVATAVAVWPGQPSNPPVAGLGLPASPTTVTMDAKTGKVLPDKQLPQSTLSAAQVVARCKPQDRNYQQGSQKAAGGGSDPISNWTVAVTQGTGSWFHAILVSPDRKRYAYCLDNAEPGVASPGDDYLRQSVTADKPYVVYADRYGAKGVVPPGIAKIEFRTVDGVVSPAVIRDGFFLWYSTRTTVGDPMAPIWAVFSDARGREVARFDANPFQPDQAGVPGGKTFERTPIFAKK